MSKEKRPMKKIMFYCQHVLGMGHFMRSLALIEGLQPLFQVCFLNGGEMVPGFTYPAGLEVINLPPLRTDAEFSDLQSVDGQSLAAVQAARTGQILTAYERFRPDVVLIELFPFGRKKFAFELLPLLARVRLSHGRTKAVCSLRDILVSRDDQERYEVLVCDLVNRYFDAVLVHADPHLQRLEESFSRVAHLQVPVRYTNYVVQTSAPVPEKQTVVSPEPTILASIGGGRVGCELLEAAIDASAILHETQPHRLQLFGGPYLPQANFRRLQEKVADQPHMNLQRYSTRFLDYMAQADLSLSMAGYNTCMNVVTTGVAALVLPFTGGDNDEQTVRARRLAALGVVEVLQLSDLQPQRLAAMMAARLQAAPTEAKVRVDGVAQTAVYLQQLTAATQTAAFPTTLNVFATMLTPILERLQTQGQQINIFLRDDDIDEDEETLRRLGDSCLAQQVPLNVEIIPGRLTKDAIQWLKSFKKFHPDLLELNQHGWQHLNHEVDGRACEFGPARSFRHQLDDIAWGKALLEKRFGESFFPVFTPPWNRCTDNTLAALDQLGFKVLSKDHGSPPVTDGYAFREISITLDIFRWKNGARLKMPATVAAELAQQLGAPNPIGIMLHHKVMGAAAFMMLDELLGVLQPFPHVHFHTFQSLYEQIKVLPFQKMEPLKQGK